MEKSVLDHNISKDVYITVVQKDAQNVNFYILKLHKEDVLVKLQIRLHNAVIKEVEELAFNANLD